MQKKLKCYIIDDEERAINALEFLLDYYCSDTAEMIGSTGSYEEALQYLSKYKPNVIFLDIKLGNRTGFELLKELGDLPNTEIVMITAYDEHALEAFKYNAINYLLKPVDPVELAKTVLRISERSANKTISTSANILKTHQERLFFPSRDGYNSLLFKDINYIKGDGSYVIIFTLTGEEITVSKNLSYFEKLLEKHPEFIRIQKSYIINNNNIIKIDKQGGLKVILINDCEIPISPSMKSKVMNLIGV